MKIVSSNAYVLQFFVFNFLLIMLSLGLILERMLVEFFYFVASDRRSLMQDKNLI